MSSPIQSGDNDYEFIPVKQNFERPDGESEPFSEAAFIAYVSFVVVFLVVIVVAIYVLWRTGRCRSKCDEESGSNSGYNSKFNSKTNSRCSSVASLSAAAGKSGGLHGGFGDQAEVPLHKNIVFLKESHPHISRSSLTSKVLLMLDESSSSSSTTHGCHKETRKNGRNWRREKFLRTQSLASSPTSPPSPSPPMTPTTKTTTTTTTRVGGLPRRSSFDDLTSLNANWSKTRNAT